MSKILKMMLNFYGTILSPNIINEPPHDKTNIMTCAKRSLKSACASAQSGQSLIVCFKDLFCRRVLMAKKQTTTKKTQTIEKFIKFISELWNITWIFYPILKVGQFYFNWGGHLTSRKCLYSTHQVAMFTSHDPGQRWYPVWIFVHFPAVWFNLWYWWCLMLQYFRAYL